MPIIQVNLMAGRSPEQKAQLAAKITAAVCETLQSAPESVRVLVTEYVEGEWFVAGKPLPAAPPSR